jgi:hypothetical protein
LLHLFNWEPGNQADREAFYYTRPQPHYEAPYAALNQQLLDTIALLQLYPTVARIGRAKVVRERRRIEDARRPIHFLLARY